LHFEGLHLKRIHKSEHPHQSLAVRPVSHPNVIFLYQKDFGAVHFHVQAGPNGRLLAGQAAGLLAKHSLVPDEIPKDYAMIVQAENDFLQHLIEEAVQLLSGVSSRGQIRLTRSEGEVLAGVLRGLSNKEIACNLNISVRTVKFHVSSLLAKFRVHGRMELVREAAWRGMGVVPRPVPIARKELRSYAPAHKDARASGSNGASSKALGARLV
jgi:DNA-binding CsgD family transcriptional regulator